MTTRDLTAGMLAAIAAGTVRPLIFYEGQFQAAGSPSEYAYLRAFTGLGQMTWNGQTWYGGGSMLSISPLEESADVKAVGFTVTFSGVPSSGIEIAVNRAAESQGLYGKLWLGLLDAAGALIADPYLLRRGKFDVSVLEANGQTCTIAAPSTGLSPACTSPSVQPPRPQAQSWQVGGATIRRASAVFPRYSTLSYSPCPLS